MIKVLLAFVVAYLVPFIIAVGLGDHFDGRPLLARNVARVPLNLTHLMSYRYVDVGDKTHGQIWHTIDYVNDTSIRNFDLNTLSKLPVDSDLRSWYEFWKATKENKEVPGMGPNSVPGEVKYGDVWGRKAGKELWEAMKYYRDQNNTAWSYLKWSLSEVKRYVPSWLIFSRQSHGEVYYTFNKSGRLFFVAVEPNYYDDEFMNKVKVSLEEQFKQQEQFELGNTVLMSSCRNTNGGRLRLKVGNFDENIWSCWC